VRGLIACSPQNAFVLAMACIFTVSVSTSPIQAIQYLYLLAVPFSCRPAASLTSLVFFIVIFHCALLVYFKANTSIGNAPSSGIPIHAQRIDTPAFGPALAAWPDHQRAFGSGAHVGTDPAAWACSSIDLADT